MGTHYTTKSPFRQSICLKATRQKTKVIGPTGNSFYRKTKKNTVFGTINESSQPNSSYLLSKVFFMSIYKPLEQIKASPSVGGLNNHYKEIKQRGCHG
jgi:hypothetical protein